MGTRSSTRHEAAPGLRRIYLGEAELRRRGDISTVEVTKARRKSIAATASCLLEGGAGLRIRAARAAEPGAGPFVSTYGGLWEPVRSESSRCPRRRDGLEVGPVLRFTAPA